MTDREISAIGNKIYKREEVDSSTKKIPLDTALWWMNLGGGFGKSTWR